MTKILPFKAIRPARDKAHLVATRPVFTYKKNILKAKLEENPYTFIRIIHPEYNEVVKTKPNSKERFEAVRKEYGHFQALGILKQDDSPHFYLYQQTTKDRVFLGIVAGASVEDYNQDHIKKHEATLTSRENMFTEYLDIVGYNAEPVLIGYPENPKLEAVYQKIMLERPEYEFSTTDEIKHELWLINEQDGKEIQDLFTQIQDTYIADGHHRSASSARLAALRNKKGVSSNNHNYFLAFFMDEKRLNILEFNRLIKSLNGLARADLLKQLEQSFIVSKLKGPEKPSSEHQITMNLQNEWYLLTCKPEIIDHNHPVACLDPEILTQYVLEPILGISDLKTDANIEFVSGNLGLDAINEPIKNGKAAVGFVLYPVSFAQVKRVADNQQIMPPKSTWVEPKLRSGLTIYDINE